MRTPLAMAACCLALFHNLPARAGDPPIMGIVLDKNMASKAAGDLVRSKLNEALTRGGYRVVPLADGKRAGLDLTVRVDILRFPDGEKQVRYELGIQAVAPDAAIVSAALAKTPPVAAGDSAALQALRPAIEQANQQLLGYLAKNGLKPTLPVERYILIFENAPSDGATQLKDILELSCRRVALASTEGARVTFQVECRAILDQIKANLAAGIQLQYDGAQARFEQRGQRALIVTFP